MNEESNNDAFKHALAGMLADVMIEYDILTDHCDHKAMSNDKRIVAIREITKLAIDAGLIKL